MQRMINDPDQVVPDMLKGFVKAHPTLVAATANPRVLRYRDAPLKNKVGIVTGGGSGHKPAFIGYIGRNMVDAVAAGEIFSSPPASSSILSTPTGRTLMTAPGTIGRVLATSTSIGSPSFDNVCGTKP